LGLASGAAILSFGSDSAHGVAEKSVSTASAGAVGSVGSLGGLGAPSVKPEEILAKTRSVGLPAAINELEALQKQSPGNLHLANQLAVLWAAAGDLDRSRESLEQALSNHPETATAFLNLRELASQQFALAYAKAIGQNPPGNRLNLEAAGLELASVQNASALFQTSEARKKEIELAAAKQQAEKLAMERAASESAKWRESATRTNEASGLVTFGSPRDPELVERILKHWAKSWAQKDFQKYADFYSAAFKTSQFPSKQVWLDHRRPRIIGKSKILVELDAIKVEFLSDHRAQATFSQRYESGSLKLNTRKKVLLVFEDKTWRIQSEGN
jgi:hypothetical protein